MGRKKKETIKTLKNRLWRKVSEYSRRKYGDYTICVCCKAPSHWKELHAGHFIPKARGEFYRWELDNIHPQCPSCNLTGNYGNETAKVQYTLWMQENFGQEYVDYLLDKSDKERKYKRWDYEEMEKKVDELLSLLYRDGPC